MTTEHPSLPSPSRSRAIVPWQQLWQIPTLLLGLAAILAAWKVQPSRHHQSATPIDNQIASLRQLAEAPGADPQQALTLGQELLERAVAFPEREGEIQFLLGSVYVRLASRAAPGADKPLWQQAREHLQEASALGAPEPDRAHLLYRLALALDHTGGDLHLVIDLLAANAENGSENPAEAYRLLTDAYLRLPKPDVRAALVANQKQLASPCDDEKMVAAARLCRGQLLLEVQQPDEARKVLARIPSTAPSGIQQQAKLLCAQSFQDEMSWAEAARLWEEILRDRVATSMPTGRINYDLGLCYRHLRRPADAERAWSMALSQGGEVAQAAALRLADLRLGGKEPVAAVTCYERAVQDVRGPSTYQNTLVELNEAQALFERGCRLLVKCGEFASAHQVARWYGQLALAESSKHLLAQVLDAWAADCRARAHQATGTQTDRLETEARAHFTEAGAVYEALAAHFPSPAEKVRWLWLSAQRYLEAPSNLQALLVLEQFLALETQPDRLGEAWFRLAEAQRALGNEAKAQAAYHKCIEFPSSYAYQARYELALVYIQEGKWDNAEEALKQNLELMQGSEAGDLYKRSLRALAQLYMKRGDYRLASTRWQEALDRYPNDSEKLQDRFQLAQCYEHLAAQEEQKLARGPSVNEDTQIHLREQQRQWLDKAATQYQKIVDDLASRDVRQPLAPAEQHLFEQTLLALAACHFNWGDYAGAVRHYQRLIDHSPHQPVALQALKEITRCYLTQKDRASAATAIQQFRILLESLPDGTLLAQPEGKSRQEWEEWLKWAAQQ